MGTGWVDAGGGYTLSLEGRTLICKNAKGKQLASVPSKVKKSEVGESLLALRDWLDDHRQQCRDQVVRWMQRSLEVPTALVEQVWADPNWRAPLENLVAHPPGDAASAGFLRDASPKEGLGVVDLDGESSRITTPTVVLPHPILIDELDEWRELAADLSLQQGVPQLHREVWKKPEALEKAVIEDYRGGKFEQLRHVLGKCRTLGYKVSGGYAVCPIWEEGAITEARFWIGSDDPESEAYTGDLIWVDKDQKQRTLEGIGPVAWSEGHRMAASIFAARVVEKEEGDA